MRDFKFPAQEGLCGLDERTSCRYVQGHTTAQLFRLEKCQACNVDLEGNRPVRESSCSPSILLLKRVCGFFCLGLGAGAHRDLGAIDDD